MEGARPYAHSSSLRQAGSRRKDKEDYMKVQAVDRAAISPPAQRIQVSGFVRPWARVCRSMRQVYVGHTHHTLADRRDRFGASASCCSFRWNGVMAHRTPPGPTSSESGSAERLSRWGELTVAGGSCPRVGVVCSQSSVVLRVRLGTAPPVVEGVNESATESVGNSSAWPDFVGRTQADLPPCPRL